MITETGLKRLRERLKFISCWQEGMKIEIDFAKRHNNSSLGERETILKELELEYETLESLLDNVVTDEVMEVM